jgi:hypothetical protein
MVGNILMDTLRFNYHRLKEPVLAKGMRVKEGDYLLLTLNRKALLADKENLRCMLEAMVEQAVGLPILAPLRERAASVVNELMGEKIKIQPSFGYLEFGWLMAHARGIITDSGNVAEEATFYGVPCITLNSYTEHIETVKVGSNVLVGEDADLLAKSMNDMVGGRWKKCAIPDRWDGRTAERILQIINISDRVLPVADGRDVIAEAPVLVMKVMLLDVTVGSADDAVLLGPPDRFVAGLPRIQTACLDLDKAHHIVLYSDDVDLPAAGVEISVKDRIAVLLQVFADSGFSKIADRFPVHFFFSRRNPGRWMGHLPSCAIAA